MIRFERVTKRYPDGTTAVDDLSFEVSEGELVTLVGPSGRGKTTTMMMVNRLIEPTSGRIPVNDEDIATVQPVRLRRRIGYVIQQVGPFPHRTVLDNTATVPTLVGWKKAKARARAASCSIWWAWTRRRTDRVIRNSCRAVSGSGSGWRGRWPPTRRCC